MASDLRRALTVLEYRPEDAASLAVIHAFEKETQSGERLKSGDAEVRDRLRRSRERHRAYGDHEVALALLDAEIALENDAKARGELLLLRAQILYEDAMDRAGAAKTLTRVIAEAASTDLVHRAEDRRAEELLIQENWKRILERHV